MNFLTISILIALNIIYSNDTDSQYEHLKLEVLTKQVHFIEPLRIKVNFLNKNSKFKVYEDTPNFGVQIRKKGTKKWTYLNPYGYKTGASTLSHPNYKKLEKGDSYEEVLALSSWRGSTRRTKDIEFSSYWHYYPNGVYEIRAFVKMDGQKEKYSKVHLFEVVPSQGIDKELIDYLSSLDYPQFLFDYYAFSKDLDHAQYISSEFRNAKVLKWARFYILDHIDVTPKIRTKS